MNYKGYIGYVEHDEEADILFGRVLNTNDVITFEGKSIEEIKQAFQDSVDDYLEFCKELGKEPEKTFSGKLLYRTTPKVHRQITIAATKQNKSINAWLDEAIKLALSK